MNDDESNETSGAPLNDPGNKQPCKTPGCTNKVEPTSIDNNNGEAIRMHRTPYCKPCDEKLNAPNN
jgi:hypothetical protein